MAVRFCSPAAPRRSSPTKMSAASISAKASSFRCHVPLNPFGLSLSKPFPSLLRREEGRPFDKLRANGALKNSSMALGPRLDLRQSQSLVMTPQLQQAIRLLALSNLEVESFIAEEIEKNPLLESGAPESEPGGEPDAEPAAEAAEALPEVDSGGGEAALDIDQDSEDFH